MFKANIIDKHQPLFQTSLELSKSQIKKLNISKEAAMCEIIFKHIDEYDYSVLYDNENNYKEIKSFTYQTNKNNGENLFNKDEQFSFLEQKRSNPTGRPNTSVRHLIMAIIIKNHYGLTDEQLFHNLEFNLLTRRALGVYGLGKKFFSSSTYYNFLNRLSDYYDETGINLFEETFNKLTAIQIKALKIKTDIQRTDSRQMMSNIKKHTRLSLLVDIINGVYKILSEEEKLKFKEIYSDYIVSSEKFIYKLKKIESDNKLKDLISVYDFIYKSFYDKHKKTKEFSIFIRAYEEHFTFKLPKLEDSNLDKKKRLKTVNKKKRVKFQKRKKNQKLTIN